MNHHDHERHEDHSAPLPPHLPQQQPASESADDRVLISRALDGDTPAIRRLVDALTPVVRAHVARALSRRRRAAAAARARSIQQDVEDLTQDVFVALFSEGGWALRAWDPSRGLSLAKFVGLLTDREVCSILRSGRTSPWTAEPRDMEALERLLDSADPAATATATSSTESIVASRELLRTVLARLRELLSPRGLEMFYRLLIHEEPLAQVAAATGVSVPALYAWRSRLGKLARGIATDEGAPRPPKLATRVRNVEVVA